MIKLFLAFSLNELDDAVTKINQDLKLTFEWCCTNYLLINPTKTKVMVFGVPQLVSKLPQDITFTLMDKQLTISSNAKDLGVTLDPYVNYNDHIANVVSSCMRALVQINRVRHLFKREILINLSIALYLFGIRSAQLPNSCPQLNILNIILRNIFLIYF
jgi:hypothetical protein